MFQTDVIKRLASRFGRTVDLMNPGTGSTNFETGKVTRPMTTITIRALCMPGYAIKEQFQLSTKPNPFAYGGGYQAEDLRVIFTKKVIGSFEITKQTILSSAGHRYLPKEIATVEDEYFDVLFHRIDDIDLGRVTSRPAAAEAGTDVHH